MQRFTAEGTYLAQFGASGPNDGQFSEPKGIALDAAGNIWVADTANNRVQVSSATEFLRHFGGESSGPGRLAAPAGVAIDAEGNAWVADTAHNRIQVFNSKGQFLRQFGATGSGNGQFISPRGVAIAPNGNLFVADTGNKRVQVFKPSGEFVRKFGSEGTGNGQFKALQDLTVDAEGNVWTLEGGGFLGNNRVQKLSAEGTYISQFGTAGSGNGQLQSPRGIALDATGNVWVADTANNRIQAFKPNGEFIGKFGALGEANGQLKAPHDLAFDAEGNIWVDDTGNNRIQRFSSEGTYLSQLGAPGPNPGQFADPQALALDAAGDLWVADTGNSRVQEWQWPLDSTYAYDQAGNLTSVERSRPGHPPSISQTFAYDGSGLMTSKGSGPSTQHFTWDPTAGLPLLLNDEQNSYIYGPHGLPIAQISLKEEPTYLHHDQLGSTRLLTTATGKPTATFTYTAYGEPAAKTGHATTLLGYAGQYTDAETDLQYLRARFYDPAMAQFLTRDPIEDFTREPYVYAYDNPLGYSDPDGLWGVAIPASCLTPVGAPACSAAASAAVSTAASLCGSSALCRDTLGEVGSELEGAINSILGGDDADDDVAEESAPYDPSEAEIECPTGDYWEGLNKEIGDGRQSFDEAKKLKEKLDSVAGSDPEHPTGGSRAVRALGLLGRLIDEFFN
jgi:RHS repeat-associated protein